MLSKSVARSKRPSRRVEKELAPVFKAGIRLSKSRSRFAADRYLQEVYRLYNDWKRKRLAEWYSRRIARLAGTSVHHDMHPIRPIIDATCRYADRKRISRWVRALQFAELENVRSDRLRRFFRHNGGIAGCARKAAIIEPKRKTQQRNDWL
jgi:hypothetical protein